MSGDKLIDASFVGEAANQLAKPQYIEQPKSGSPGIKNPAVERYDPTGLRSAMTTTHAATQRAIAQSRERHLPRSTWELDGSGPLPNVAGRPTIKRVNAWGYTQTNDW